MYRYCIPYLDFDGVASNHYLFGGELDSHGRIALWNKRVVDVAIHDGAFADWGISNEDILEDVVIVECLLHDYYYIIYDMKIWSDN